MKIILKMLQSIDGIISQNLPQNKADKLEWGSSVDKQSFRELVANSDATIIGSTTFLNMPSWYFKTRPGIIITRSVASYESKYADSGRNLKFLEPDPKIIKEYLKSQNYQNIILGGGSKINYIILKAGMVDEIHLTIAPKIFAKGVRIIDSPFDDFVSNSENNLENNLDINLELIESDILGNSELLLKYKIIK
jgi:riboflavin biosynthesis pyrimidine reductase